MSLSDKVLRELGYSISELQLILRQQQLSLRKEIEMLTKEINERSGRLEAAAQRLIELERAENLLED
jgi:DNA-binding transcriptional MerR regulator